MPDTRPVPKWWRNLQWFVVGGVIASIGWYYESSRGITSMNETQLRQLQEQLNTTRANLLSVTQERDTCNAKFNRGTILYDIGILGGQTRAWFVPVDMEPVVFSGKRGAYTHYDPNTQTETVLFQPKQKP